MTTYIASDLHINHRNILSYCPHRGGPEITDENVAKMNEMIITNWNSVVGTNDEVYILGDVAMGQIHLAPPLIRQLNGKKYLVRGNHDKTLTKRVNGKSLADDLFEWVKDYHEMFVEVAPHTKQMVVMSHFPMASWNGMNNGSVMLHGHLHGSPCAVTGRIYDVGIDTNNMTPYNMVNLLNEVRKIDVIRDHH